MQYGSRFLSGLSPEFSLAKAQMMTGPEVPNSYESYHKLDLPALFLSKPTKYFITSALTAINGRDHGSFLSRGIGTYIYIYIYRGAVVLQAGHL